jgi:hypothetical protein
MMKGNEQPAGPDTITVPAISPIRIRKASAQARNAALCLDDWPVARRITNSVKRRRKEKNAFLLDILDDNAIVEIQKRQLQDDHSVLCLVSYLRADEAAHSLHPCIQAQYQT